MFLYCLTPDYPKEVALTTTSVNLSKEARTSGNKRAMMVKPILSLMEKLTGEGMGFVGCQKCVHPLVKDYLKEQVRLSGCCSARTGLYLF